MPPAKKPAADDGAQTMWEVQHVLFKQRAAIEKLRADNAALKEELALENKFSMAPSQSSADALISNLQHQSDACTAKIQAEQQRLGMVSAQQRAVKAQVAAQRRKMGGTNAATKQEQAGQTKVRLLENKLEQGYHALNELQASIRAIRSRVDGLRRERLLFDDVLRKADKDWVAQKSEMVSLIKATSVAHDQRQKALEDAAALKRSADRETATFEAEWRQLSMLIEADRKLQEAARAKELKERDKRTALLLSGAAEAVATIATAATPPGTPPQTLPVKKKPEEEQPEPSEVDTAMQRMDQLRMALDDVRAATGEGDVAKLAKTLKERDDQVFDLYTYLNSANIGVEDLNKRIGVVRKEVDRVKAAIAERRAATEAADEARTNEIHRAKDAAAAAEARVVSANESLDSMCGSVTAAYQAARCGMGNKVLQEMLGTEGAKPGKNMMQHLGVLEQRLNELIEIRGILKAAAESRRTSANSRRGTGTAPGAPNGQHSHAGSARSSATGARASATGSDFSGPHRRGRNPGQGLLAQATRRAGAHAEGGGGGTTVPGVQLGKKKGSEKPRSGGAYANLNDLRRMLGLPPMTIPSTLFDENDPTNDFEANDTQPLTMEELEVRARRALALRKAVAESEAAMGGTPRGNGTANTPPAGRGAITSGSLRAASSASAVSKAPSGLRQAAVRSKVPLTGKAAEAERRQTAKASASSNKAAPPALAATSGRPAATEVVAAGGTMIEEVQLLNSGSGKTADGLAPVAAEDGA